MIFKSVDMATKPTDEIAAPATDSPENYARSRVWMLSRTFMKLM